MGHNNAPVNAWRHPQHPLRSPLELFALIACHGGIWRSPFKANSYSEVSAMLYFLNQVAPWATAATVGGAVALAVHRSRL